MSDVITFTNTRLAGTGKQGILRPDENGYYTTPLGGLDVYNTVGEFYTKEGSAALFEESSAFMRRVRRGALRSEVAHPEYVPGMSEQEYVNRMMNIDEARVCAHISDIWLDFDNFKDESGRKVVGIVGKVKPSGVMGHFLAAQFENPKENVCFSVRGITEDYRKGGQTYRKLINIITFDYVNEPGISIAEKYNSPALESVGDKHITRSQFERAIVTANSRGMATENSKNIAREVYTEMGWKLPEPKKDAIYKSW